MISSASDKFHFLMDYEPKNEGMSLRYAREDIVHDEIKEVAPNSAHKEHLYWAAKEMKATMNSNTRSERKLHRNLVFFAEVLQYLDSFQEVIDFNNSVNEGLNGDMYMYQWKPGDTVFVSSVKSFLHARIPSDTVVSETPLMRYILSFP